MTASLQQLADLTAELEHLVAEYEDSDRQDEELRAAIRKQKRLIVWLEKQQQVQP